MTWDRYRSRAERAAARAIIARVKAAGAWSDVVLLFGDRRRATAFWGGGGSRVEIVAKDGDAIAVLGQNGRAIFRNDDYQSLLRTWRVEEKEKEEQKQPGAPAQPAQGGSGTPPKKACAQENGSTGSAGHSTGGKSAAAEKNGAPPASRDDRQSRDGVVSASGTQPNAGTAQQGTANADGGAEKSADHHSGESAGAGSGAKREAVAHGGAGGRPPGNTQASQGGATASDSAREEVDHASDATPAPRSLEGTQGHAGEGSQPAEDRGRLPALGGETDTDASEGAQARQGRYARNDDALAGRENPFARGLGVADRRGRHLLPAAFTATFYARAVEEATRQGRLSPAHYYVLDWREMQASRQQVARMRAILARMVGGHADAGPRWDAKKVSARLAGYLQRWRVDDRKEEDGHPAVIVLPDISGSMAAFAEDVMFFAWVVGHLGVPGADVVVVPTTNGYPLAVSENGEPFVRVDEAVWGDEETTAAWYDDLAQRFNVRAIVIFADDDGEAVYAHLAKQCANVERIYWLDVYRSTQVERPVVEKTFPPRWALRSWDRASYSTRTFSRAWTLGVARKVRYVWGVGDANDALDALERIAGK